MIERGPRPPRRLQRLLRLPARSRRAPDRALLVRLLHRRPGPQAAALVGQRPPLPLVLGRARPDSWYDESSLLLGPDGEPVPIEPANVDERAQHSEVVAYAVAGAESTGAPDGLTPGKVIAVHLNYRSRAAQRGRVPTEPSYFLKPPSSLSAGGDRRPAAGHRAAGVRGRDRGRSSARRARNVTPEQAGGHIGWYAPANDFGVHDFRWADRGSNVLAKGQDGFTPIGPARCPPREVDPAALHLPDPRQRRGRARTRPAPTCIFTFAQLIADLVAVHDARARRRDPHRHAGRGQRRGARRRGRGRRSRASGRVTQHDRRGRRSSARIGAMPKVDRGGARVRDRRRTRRARVAPCQRRRRRGAAPGLDRDADRAAQPPRHPKHVPRRPAPHPAGSADGRLRPHAALRRRCARTCATATGPS